MADPVLSATLSGKKAILLSWTFDSNADFQVFWKSSAPAGQDYVVLATTNAFSYITPDIEPSKTYFFYVQANVGVTFVPSNIVELFVSCGKGVVLSGSVSPPPPNYRSGDLLVSDTVNYRVMKRRHTGLGYIDEVGAIVNPGPAHTHVASSGAGGFASPRGVLAKGDYYYIADSSKDLQIRRFDNHAYIDKIDISSGNAAIANAQNVMDIACDGTYLYTINYAYPFAIKRRLSDLSYVSHFGNGAYFSSPVSVGDGTYWDWRYYDGGTRYNGFAFPFGIDTDGEFLWIADTGNHRIVKLRCDTMSFVADYGKDYGGVGGKTTGFSGSGDGEFSGPLGLALVDSNIIVLETGNSRIQKITKNGGYISKIGSIGAGDDQFDSPSCITSFQGNLYITDSYNHRIQKRLGSDLSFISKIGSAGHGDDNFSNQILGITVWEP